MIYNEKLVCFCILIMKPINQTHTHTQQFLLLFIFKSFHKFEQFAGFVCIMEWRNFIALT